MRFSVSKNAIAFSPNSEFINKFLSYYASKNGVPIVLEKEKDCDEISKFLHYGEGVRERLQKTSDPDPLALAKLLLEN